MESSRNYKEGSIKIAQSSILKGFWASGLRVWAFDTNGEGLQRRNFRVQVKRLLQVGASRTREFVSSPLSEKYCNIKAVT